MAQLAYHVSTGTPLWDYPVRQGTVLYLAIEDGYKRLQERLYRMFSTEGTEKLHFSEDKFDMISGTNGLLGAADGAFLLHKEKHTSNSAILEISGRAQQDQKLNLC